MLKKIISVIIIAVIGFSGCDQKEETKEEVLASGARNVKTAVAYRGEIDSYLDYAGKIELENVLNIGPSLSARIVKVQVEEGEKVQKDQVLIELDDTQLEQTRIKLENVEKNLQRMEKLLEKDAVEQKTYDEIKMMYETTRSAYEYLEENTIIKAPITGIVADIYKEAGEKFDAMMDPYLLRLVNDDLVKAKIDVSDRDIDKVKKGMRAVISINNSDKIFKGKVSYCSPEADMLSGTFPVELIITNASSKLRHNQFANIKIITEFRKNAIIVPQEAIIDDNKLFVVKNNIAEQRMVDTGIGNETEIEIKKGIEAGEKVIIQGSVGLVDGDKVNENSIN